MSSFDQQHEILALSFETAESGFVYYKNSWSRGIPVTAEEREAFLRIPALGSRRHWLASLGNRPTLPRRAYFPTAHKIMAAQPFSLIPIAAIIGGLAILFGVFTDDLLLAVMFFLAGASFLFSSVAYALAKVFLRAAD